MNKRFLVENGVSVLEVILAAAVFIIFSSGATVALIQGYMANRVGVEYTIATQFATEGLEAVRSIRSQSFVNLDTVNTQPRAVQRPFDVWVFGSDNSSNILNVVKPYTRQVKVEPVYRDSTPPGGNIVNSGTLDPLAKKVTSTVSWEFNTSHPGTRSESVSLVTYLTDWRKSLLDNGFVSFANISATNPKYKTYTHALNTFSGELDTVQGATGKNFVSKTSPNKTQALVAYGDNASTQVLRVMCFDGLSWTNEWEVAIGGSGSTRKFDIAYETQSGDAVVLYAKEGSGSNFLEYRLKQGSADCNQGWSAPQTFPASPQVSSGNIQWVRLARDRRGASDVVAALWADSNADLAAAVWSGSAWGGLITLENDLERIAVPGDVEDFDIEFESLSGDILVVWANLAGNDGTNGVRFNTCSGGGGTCSWGSVRTPPTFQDDAHNLDISANPLTDSIIFGSIGDAGDDLQVGVWNGSSWKNVANKDKTAKSPVAGGKNIATGWVSIGGETRGIVVYHDNVTSGVVSYLTVEPKTNPVWSNTLTASTTPDMGTLQNWYQIESDPINPDTLMLVASDSNNRMYAKRLVMTLDNRLRPLFSWTDANGGQFLSTNLPQSIASPFSYVYWRLQ